MTSFRSPSHIVAKAAGLAPLGTPATKPGKCALCGYAHQVGDPVADFACGDSFTDFGAMRGAGSPTVCGWCLVTWSADFTQRYTKSIICSDGVFPAASNDHLAYWMLNPPEGEWIFVQSDQKRQHVIWRAAVNRSKDVFVVRYGELQLTIRPAALSTGADAARRLAQFLSVGRKGAALKSPFVRLSRDIDDPAHGTLRADLYKHCEDPDVARDIETIHRLTPGELWGLTAVLYANNPQRPEPKLSSSLT